MVSIGDVAGLIAAIAFVGLVGFLGFVSLKVAAVLDETRSSVKELTDHTLPMLDEAAKVVASSASQMDKVDTVTTAAAQVGENVSALSSLVTATVGAPLLKVAAFSYGVRRALAGLRAGGARR